MFHRRPELKHDKLFKLQSFSVGGGDLINDNVLFMYFLAFSYFALRVTFCRCFLCLRSAAWHLR